MRTKATYIKLAAAIGLGAGSATAMHTVSSVVPPTLPSTAVAVTETSTTTTTDGTAVAISKLSGEESALQSQLNAAKAILASHLNSPAANQNVGVETATSSASTTFPITHATTGASSAKSDDGSGDDSSVNKATSGESSKSTITKSEDSHGDN